MIYRKFARVFYSGFFIFHLYDDRITIDYNTSLNPTEEIYNKPDDDPNNNDNNGGTTIYKTELNFENEQEKSRPNSNEFKRLLNGGAVACQIELLISKQHCFAVAKKKLM